MWRVNTLTQGVANLPLTPAVDSAYLVRTDYQEAHYYLKNKARNRCLLMQYVSSLIMYTAP
jgi:hypothetical protein